MAPPKTSQKIAFQQKKRYWLLMSVLILLGMAIVAFLLKDDLVATSEAPRTPQHFDTISKEASPGDIRLASLENFSDILGDRIQSLEKSVLNLKEENSLIAGEKEFLTEETHELKNKLKALESDMSNRSASLPPLIELSGPAEAELRDSPLKIWEPEEKKEDKHVLFEIPAGTVVKALLVSGADCSVAVQKPTGPNMVLLRPLDNGKLPRKVAVPLKGSIIIGNAIGDISSERVYVRAERMTLVERDGSFVETEVSAYVSGEDGREGLRGVVVDRSGAIISRVAFSAVLQGVAQTIQGTLNNQTIEKLAQTNSDKTILNIDMLRNSAFQGGSAAANKLADYYIKKSEQLQPAIQIAAGRIVDVVFTKTVKIGEKDLKKQFDHEREVKKKGRSNG
jgi:conjugal transfer pilus assembly protein TraB